MTFWIWATIATVTGVDVIIYAWAGADAFWWTLFGQLALIFAASVMEACRKASDQ